MWTMLTLTNCKLHGIFSVSKLGLYFMGELSAFAAYLENMLYGVAYGW
jgi:hypothetical protein